MKHETKAFLRKTGKEMFANALVNVIGTAVMAGVGYLGANIGSKFSKTKPITTDISAEVPMATHAEAPVDIVIEPAVNDNVEVTDV